MHRIIQLKINWNENNHKVIKSLSKVRKERTLYMYTHNQFIVVLLILLTAGYSIYFRISGWHISIDSALFCIKIDESLLPYETSGRYIRYIYYVNICLNIYKIYASIYEYIYARYVRQSLKVRLWQEKWWWNVKIPSQGTSEWSILFMEAAELPEFIFFSLEKI